MIYSLLYVFTKWLIDKIAPSLLKPGKRVIRIDSIIAYTLLLGLITGIIRQPGGYRMDKWIAFLGFIQMEPAHIPQYLSLFILGVLAYRWSFLESISRPRNIFWLIPGLGIFLVIIILLFSISPQVAFYNSEISEAIMCTGMCIGLLALFNKFFNKSGFIMRTLAGNIYGMYIFHLPVVVALQFAFDPVKASPLKLYIIVSILSVLGTFFVSYAIRLIPRMKRII